ncbi:MAG: SPOR domain-containing protein [Pseudomonadota bacterium]
MIKTHSLLNLLLPLLLVACASEPAKPEPPPPAVEETPAAGSQAEADAVAADIEEEDVKTTATEAESATEEKTPPAADENREPQTHASASAVLPPAWIFRGDVSTALLPGTAIYEGDRVETGADGRVQLMLDDGAKLQIGGSAQLTITRLAPNETSSLNGTLDIGKGSFAFESGKNGTLLPGDLDFKLGKLTAFATQAAMMGKSDSKESAVCLLTGTAEVALQGQDPVTLNTPKSCVATTKTSGTGASQIKTLEQSLQPPAGVKAMKHKGTWSLILMSDGSEAAAKKSATKLWKAGYPAEVIEAKVKGKTYYRVVLRGFESRDAAGTLKKRAAALGYPKAWVNQK